MPVQKVFNGTDWVSVDATNAIVNTSGDWTYRISLDGTIEAWGVVSLGDITGTQWVTNLYFENVSITVPTGIFSSAPSFISVTPVGSLQSNGWTVWGACAVNATTLSVRFCKPVASSMSLSAAIYLRN